MHAVNCGSPAAPSRGSVDISGGTPPLSLGSTVTYRCDEGLFPPDVRTSTCTDVEGRGEWVHGESWELGVQGEARYDHSKSSFDYHFLIPIVNCSLYPRSPPTVL